ncbi:hypothetical protein HY612_05600 [Candidatus Roizmanbacteria bacterium]|nr:hypothetical protein [Candidatus Roizmanbacteria bacterium]
MSEEYRITEDSTFTKDLSRLITADNLEPLPDDIADFGTTSRVRRIKLTSPYYPGMIFKIFRPLNKSRVFEQNFGLNALALGRLNWYPLALGRVPKLLTKGNYHGIPAVIESPMEGVNPDIELLSADKRVRYYQSLAGLYFNLALFGIIHAGPSDFDIAIKNNRAGLIDFGGAFVEGSSLHNFSSKQEAEIHATKVFKDWVESKEKRATGYIHGLSRFGRIPSSTLAGLYISTLRLHT